CPTLLLISFYVPSRPTATPDIHPLSLHDALPIYWSTPDTQKEHTMADNPTIEGLSQEDRTFEPPPEFAAQANVTAEEYDKAEADRIGFLAEKADRITWAEPFELVVDGSDAPLAKWYLGGKLNDVYNCVDRNVEAGLDDRIAYHFEGEGGDTRTITYADLMREVSKAANALIELCVQTGDRVAIYMPMIPVTVFSILAFARIGSPHTVIFFGFLNLAIAHRIQQC